MPVDGLGMTNRVIDLTLPLTADARAVVTAFVAQAPRLTSAVALALHAGEADDLAAAAKRLRRISTPIGATTVAGVAELLERAALAGRLGSVPDDHGLGAVMASAVVACRELLVAQP